MQKNFHRTRIGQKSWLKFSSGVSTKQMLELCFIESPVQNPPLFPLLASSGIERLILPHKSQLNNLSRFASSLRHDIAMNQNVNFKHCCSYLSGLIVPLFPISQKWNGKQSLFELRFVKIALQLFCTQEFDMLYFLPAKSKLRRMHEYDIQISLNKTMFFRENCAESAFVEKLLPRDLVLNHIFDSKDKLRRRMPNTSQ